VGGRVEALERDMSVLIRKEDLGRYYGKASQEQSNRDLGTGVARAWELWAQPQHEKPASGEPGAVLASDSNSGRGASTLKTRKKEKFQKDWR
jgi:hypothetical protein